MNKKIKKEILDILVQNMSISFDFTNCYFDDYFEDQSLEMLKTLPKTLSKEFIQKAITAYLCSKDFSSRKDNAVMIANDVSEYSHFLFDAILRKECELEELEKEKQETIKAEKEKTAHDRFMKSLTSEQKKLYQQIIKK